MKNNFKKGYSLIEIVFTIGILTLIISGVGAFQSGVFSFNRIIQFGINNQYEAKKIIKPFVNEVRGAVSSDTGSYALEEVGTSTFTFYSNIDNDQKIEKVRYFLEENTLKKGITKSQGDPLVYSQENEEIVQTIHNIISKNIFEYYGSNYDGFSSSTSLTFPIKPEEVRLVKIKLQIDNDLNKEPGPLSIETQVSIRNLKDNY